MATPTQATSTRTSRTPPRAKRNTLARQTIAHLAAMGAAAATTGFALWVCGVESALGVFAAVLLGRAAASLTFHLDRLRWGEWGLRDARLWFCAAVCGSGLAALVVRQGAAESIVRVLLVEALVYGIGGLLLDDAVRCRRARVRPLAAASQPCFVYGSRGKGRSLAQGLLRNPCELQPFAYLDDDPQLEETIVDGLPVLGSLDDLTRLARLHGVADILAPAPSDELTEAAGYARIRIHYGHT